MRRQSIRMGSIIADAEIAVPATVVLPQDMGKKIAERRPVWSTTLVKDQDSFVVVQHN